MGLPPPQLGPLLVCRRRPDRLDTSGRGHCHGAFAGTRRRRDARFGRRLRCPPGFGKGPSIPMPQDHLSHATLAKETMMKIRSKDFRAREATIIVLRKWPALD